ncbi:MAG: DUF2807 domain-containing protein [Prevotellaceae bacterium]|jgi:hypothetical protein|nr:DUF2807 domain-containing protein [Prevotellaceae bacterium]
MKTLALLFALASLTSCSVNANSRFQVIGSNTYVTKSIPVDDFHAISVSGSPDVVFTQRAGAPSVEVYTSDNIVDLLDIRVESRTLLIRFKKNANVSYKKLEVRVSAPRLTAINVGGSSDVLLANGLESDEDLSIQIGGSGDIAVRDKVTCQSLNLKIGGSGDATFGNLTATDVQATVSGSGDLTLGNLTATDVQATVSGSGDIELKGEVQTADFQVSGSGEITAKKLQAKRVNAGVSGAGEITCFVTEYLKARTSGSGSIGYKGNPQLDIPKKGVYKL